MLEKGESQNIAAVHRIYEFLSTKNLPAMFELLSPDIRITQSTELPWGGTYVGIPEAQMLLEKLWVYVDNRSEVNYVIDGGDRIAAIGCAHITVGRTGRTFDVPFMHLWEFKEGLAVRLEIVSDVAAMRAAIGR